MRFLSTKNVIVLLATILATSSLVSSLSIPNNRDVDVDFLANGAVDLVKRAVKPHVAITTNRPTSRPPARASSTERPSSSLPRSSSAPASSASESASTSVPASSSPAPAISNVTSSPLNTTTATTDSSNSTGSTTDQAAVPTGGLSTGAVAGIGAVCGIAVLGAGIFAVMRYQRKASLTQSLSNKSVGQFNTPTPYPATSPFPAGNNAGYERLSDPSLSGASVPSGIIQQGLGTFAVVSTYTPTLGDEIEIQPGDKVTILVEYDDGWCQGINESRGKVKGVFPKHCVDYGNQGGAEEAGRGKRVSSMYGSGGYRM